MLRDRSTYVSHPFPVQPDVDCRFFAKSMDSAKCFERMDEWLKLTVGNMFMTQQHNSGELVRKSGAVRFYGEPDSRLANDFVSSSNPITASDFEGVILQVSKGLLWTADGQPVKMSEYLAKAGPVPTGAGRSAMVDAASRVWITYNAGWYNYYHWTVQAMFSTYIALTDFDETRDVFVFPSLTVNAKELLSYVIGGDVDSPKYLIPDFPHLSINRATLINSTYHSFAFNPSSRLGDFASHVKGRCPTQKMEARKLYVSRKDSPRRSIENEDEVIRYLEARGFVSLELSRLTVAEQINVFASVDVVVGSHGAGLTNTIYCDQSTRVVELMPRSYQNPCFLRIGQVLGKDWHLCVFDSETIREDGPASERVGKWRIDLDVLGTVISS